MHIYNILSNLLQDRVTDHRVSVTIPGVNRVTSAEALDDIIQVLIEKDDKESLENFLQSLEKPNNIQSRKR